MQLKLKFIYILLIFNIISCNTSTNKSTKPETKAEKEKRFESFAKQLETSIKEGNYKFLNTSWDIELFKRNVAEKGIVASNVLKSGEKYYKKVIYKVNNDLVDEVKQYGKFYLSRFHIENNIPKAFYTYKTDLGINFIEFVFSQKGKDIKIIDFYNFQTGEYYSESVKNMIRFVNKYGGSEGAYFDAMQLVGLAIKQASDKRDKVAWKTINAITDNILKDNYFQYKRILIASMISDKLYYQAVEDFLALEPDNEKLQLYYRINLHRMKKEKKKLDTTVQEMEKIVGKSELFTGWQKNL